MSVLDAIKKFFSAEFAEDEASKDAVALISTGDPLMNSFVAASVAQREHTEDPTKLPTHK